MSAQPPASRAAALRGAAPVDYPAVVRLLTSADLPTAGVPASLDGFLVAEHDGAIVGAAALEPAPPYGLLRSVVVAPSWRGTGLGAALVRRLLADADSRGVRAVYLLTTTAEQWFPRFGFAQVARDAVPEPVRQTEEFRDACPASAPVMVREAAR